MLVIGYDNTAVRDDLIAVHNRAWERLGSPGTWWPARKRVAIAAEVRRVRDCSLCQRRKEALSPYSIEGEHESSAELPSAVIEVVHRIVSDPGRLTRRWYDGVIGSGLSEAHYVEIVGVIATIVMIDTYARGIGQEPPTLPAAERGDPSNYMPDGVGELGAWVYMIRFEDHQPPESDLFPNGPIANIRASLSLVPGEARNFNDLVDHHYAWRPTPDDFYSTQRSISQAQTKLLAARVSALNGCFY
jgi:hypothetical protein